MNQVRCPACQSEKLVPHIKVVSEAGDSSLSSQVRIIFPKRPEALLFKGKYETPVYVNICGTCGHCSMFVENPDEVWEEYVRAQRLD